MALIALVRGMNVGGYRRFRPSTVASELRAFDVVNVGAAGTFVVRQPRSDAEFLRQLRQRLPIGATLAVCNGEDLLRLAEENPFGTEPAGPDLIPFVSLLVGPGRADVSLPFVIPELGGWFVRVLGRRDRLVFGLYRRRMKSIGYLGEMDARFGTTATTRSWRTALSLLRILQSDRG